MATESCEKGWRKGLRNWVVKNVEGVGNARVWKHCNSGVLMHQLTKCVRNVHMSSTATAPGGVCYLRRSPFG